MRIKSVFLIGSLLIFFACSTIPKSRQIQEQQLFEHLSQWENLRIDGVAEINYKGFVIRKNIVIKKNKNAIRADLYDSGIFGMSPTPFASIYLSEEILIQMPGQTSASQYEVKDEEDLKMIKKIIFQTEKLMKYKNEIIAGRKLKIGSVRFLFDKNMQIKTVALINNEFQAHFNFAGDSSTVTATKNKERIITITADSFSFEKQKVNKPKITENL